MALQITLTPIKTVSRKFFINTLHLDYIHCWETVIEKHAIYRKMHKPVFRVRSGELIYYFKQILYQTPWSTQSSMRQVSFLYPYPKHFIHGVNNSHLLFAAWTSAIVESKLSMGSYKLKCNTSWFALFTFALILKMGKKIRNFWSLAYVSVKRLW